MKTFASHVTNPFSAPSYGPLSRAKSSSRPLRIWSKSLLPSHKSQGFVLLLEGKVSKKVMKPYSSSVPTAVPPVSGSPRALGVPQWSPH